MLPAPALIEVRRGGRLESVHCGHAAIVTPDGGVQEGWGTPSTVVYPRSSCKMVQALPLVESGAAEAAGLGDDHLALACASHNGAAIHTDRVRAWLAAEGLGEGDLRCGTQWPADRPARDALIRGEAAPDQTHNNCSGKHAGFLTLGRRLHGGPDYIDVDHPVQRAVRAAFEEMTGEQSPGHAIDGCSAPNFACTLAGLGRAMARFAAAEEEGGARGAAMLRLRRAMVAHPALVAGEGRACTALMRAMDGVAVKTGAEAVYVAIVPQRQVGVAVKIADGGTRAAEAAIAALLIHLGVLDPDHPAARSLVNAPIRNRRDIVTGEIVAAPGFPA
ncbi:asparaginase [Rhodobacteraceae bacterium CCMM004]|nr:asparaginase [Rhodobacteraceae bacterium CCMM004]